MSWRRGARRSGNAIKKHKNGKQIQYVKSFLLILQYTVRWVNILEIYGNSAVVYDYEKRIQDEHMRHRCVGVLQAAMAI